MGGEGGAGGGGEGGKKRKRTFSHYLYLVSMKFETPKGVK